MRYPPAQQISEQSLYAADSIRELMRHGGWTIRELARFLGRSHTHAWATIHGRREVTDDEITIIADMLSAPISFFYKCTALVVLPQAAASPQNDSSPDGTSSAP